MKHRDTFSGFHPVVNFVYFAFVLACSMFFMHPLCLCISFFCAFIYHIKLTGGKAIRFTVVFAIPMMFVAALLNPAFNHEGATILTYLPSGNPLTLESITYGVAAALMLASVVTWFACFNAVITSDKFVYLFGRIAPALSLLLSMSLRFVPHFRAQMKLFMQARRGVEQCAEDKRGFTRVKGAITVFSMMVTWALENAIDTADSMKSRGYGLKGRTAFSIYTFDKRDKIALVWLLACGAYMAVGWAAGAVYWSYFPVMQGARPEVYPVTVFATYLALCLTPVALHIREDRNWTRLQLKT